MSLKHWLLLLPLFLASGLALAVDQVRVLALFPDKAMLQIDGKNRLLKAGQTSPEGIRLVSATPREAVVIWNGESRTLTPGGGVQAHYAEKRVLEVRIVRDNHGSFTTSGAINGQPVDFLVDTGASGVAMSATQAKALGIRYRLTGTPIQVGTAGGVAEGHGVVLDKVRVGELELSNVGGVVVQADFGHRVLLGMSFLRRLDMSQNNNVMVLRQRR
jgi:aspartyl protease family protein